MPLPSDLWPVAMHYNHWYSIWQTTFQDGQIIPCAIRQRGSTWNLKINKHRLHRISPTEAGAYLF